MSLKDIKTIFFDLDNTLFDHMRAEQATLKFLLDSKPELFAKVNRENFLRTYDKNNTILWKQMADGEMAPSELRILRFKMTFEELNLTPIDYSMFSENYLALYSKQTFAISNAVEVLDYLKPKYSLGILSNGFPRVQESKLSRLELQSYFEYKIYSEDVGVAKPYPGIFSEAARKANSKPFETVYIGDSYENDIVGAKNFGWQAIFFNPKKTSENNRLADFEISDLKEIKSIF
ncbi:noncanonical pyrimidine nucleotidase, YjjG family [candidate division KSB1 bacterium]|nr:noncanonical pyrimidine nucleotidase, YjjG family [candidate division KSB1 bacterium]